MIAIDWIQHQIDEVDARLAHLDGGRELLEQLREKYVALLGHQSSSAEAVRNGSRTSADQAEERGFDSRPPLQSQPGAGSGQGSRRRPPSTSLSGSSAPASASIECPDCGEVVKRERDLGIHRARSKRHADAIAAGAPEPARPSAQPLGADVDRRNIDEDCPRGCGRHFRWEPSLLRHVSSCSGKRADAAPGGGVIHEAA